MAATPPARGTGQKINAWPKEEERSGPCTHACIAPLTSQLQNMLFAHIRRDYGCEASQLARQAGCKLLPPAMPALRHQRSAAASHSEAVLVTGWLGVELAMRQDGARRCW